jgi:hypothetical protein
MVLLFSAMIFSRQSQRLFSAATWGGGINEPDSRP